MCLIGEYPTFAQPNALIDIFSIQKPIEYNQFTNAATFVHQQSLKKPKTCGAKSGFFEQYLLKILLFARF